MLRLGITLIVFGAFALFLPLLGRQFILVTLFRQSGLGTPFIAIAFIGVGSLLCYLAGTKGASKDSPPSAALEQENAVYRKHGWVAISALLVIAAVIAATRYEPSAQAVPSNPFVPNNRLLSNEESIAAQIAQTPLQTYPVTNGESG